MDFDSGGKINSLYATAATDAASGDLIVKVVNASAGPLETELVLSGASNLSGKGAATVLTSESPADENSLADPLKVSPKTEAVNFSGTTLDARVPRKFLHGLAAANQVNHHAI